MTLTLPPAPKSPCFSNTLLLILLTLFKIPCYLYLPIRDAATIQPITQNPSSSSQGTIPAFPEQVNVARCLFKSGL
ncbi:putative GPI-anchored protein [Trifolium medium]|uniref:Putative GPI-anchored protein n=1 Tax=Trifolium medium TaxID=97028 RepID=A0A392MS42_9FABA|nr:putative GPI-anchored protein [Trifolium medium]